jgi:hypothetical protein
MIRPDVQRLRGALPLSDPSPWLVAAVEQLCAGESALTTSLGVAPREIAEIRGGTRVLSLPQALTVVRVLRERAALLQLAAEAVAESVQSDVARLACDAYERAVHEPDVERAVEVALQTLFDVCA